jgi:ribosomal protein S12 methylthiotransferase
MRRKNPRPLRVYISTLGCPKNLVDSEATVTILCRSGCVVTEDPREADLMLVGACSFLEAAWRETVEELEWLAKFKQPTRPEGAGGGKRLVLMGCLPKHRGEDLERELPFVDHFLPTGAQERLPALIEAWARSPHGPGRFIDGTGADRFAGFEDRIRLTPAHSAYVKVAEGCNRKCTFCAIPTIRGRLENRPLSVVVAEMKRLAETGVKEVTLLSQDIASYRDGPARLVDLVDAVAQTGIPWIRIFYLHPSGITIDHVRRLFSHPSVVRYLEMPVQHVSTRLLRRMRRSHDRAHVVRLLDGIRSEFPDAVMRSEVIVGFPGETDREFGSLVRFVEEFQFESLGIFPYSREPGTAAAVLDGVVPEAVVRQRAEELSAVQEGVSFAVQSGRIGRVFDVLVDRVADREEGGASGHGWVGRFYGQAPDVDGEVYIEAERLYVGEFARVRITDADLFDLRGEPAQSAGLLTEHA